MKARKPTVDFSFRRPNLRFPRVLEDHAHAAELVAEHFLSRGFIHFLFYSEEPNWAYQERGAAFIEALRRAGHDCRWIRWNESPDHRPDIPNYRTDRGQWKQHRKWLVAQLELPSKPLAVFAANDTHALDVLEACEIAGLAVPEQVAIVGADNYLLAPDAMQVPISSVETNLEILGYRGAALLDELMAGAKPPRKPIRVPAGGVVARRSSDLLAVNHRGLARCLRFILDHAHEPIGLQDLAGAASMSRRGLHKAFLEHLGRTPGQELQRVRIERAKRLLAHRGHKLEEIAFTCGYQSANGFYIAFKQATGKSPSAFRQSIACTGLLRPSQKAQLRNSLRSLAAGI